jgi:hypothetical protein
MEPEGSLPCSQKLATGPCPEPAESSSPHHPYIPKFHLNVILPLMPRSSQWSLPFGPPNQNPVNTSPLPPASHMSRPSHPPWFNHGNNIPLGIQAMKFIIMQFYPWSVFLPIRCLSICSSLEKRDQVTHPYSTTGKITVLCILIFSFFDMRRTYLNSCR